MFSFIISCVFVLSLEIERKRSHLGVNPKPSSRFKTLNVGEIFFFIFFYFYFLFFSLFEERKEGESFHKEEEEEE